MYIYIAVWFLIIVDINNAAPIMTKEDYQQASLIINSVSCLLQLLETFLVLIFALYKIKTK
ncbi:Maph119 [Matsumuraeses phaseoli granulovirus]|uniref:Maph119 n=1 Tax=Matsumuraeses phaseoli granulovirus TaxID=2760664 RepID=A0AAE7MLN6_9BBAC|nr:Maph119 [Matsumuraeses phaseoli granulovirus]QOD40082.1 Maph119 [Matsumuraeses phaseoli granulovirus]